MIITKSEILNPSVANLPSKATVIKLCKKKGFRHNHITYFTDDKDIFIKYNNASMDEAHTQLFFYEQIMKKRDSVIRIPEIYHAFETELGLTYILMEHIDIKDKASDEQIAQAVSELISIPPPAGVFGSISGGRWCLAFQFHDVCTSLESPTSPPSSNQKNNSGSRDEQSETDQLCLVYSSDQLEYVYAWRKHILSSIYQDHLKGFFSTCALRVELTMTSTTITRFPLILVNVF
ncbi:hypothetical protein DTO271D3_1110 [Paecilomyces variotii]|nr:hypothetical protein DTO169E5_3713 [Paecilomyces variotii]KAJ9318448.1 hypothetical protein DTO271D3_1110 [Paecilomyces variotii]